MDDDVVGKIIELVKDGYDITVGPDAGVFHDCLVIITLNKWDASKQRHISVRHRLEVDYDFNITFAQRLVYRLKLMQLDITRKMSKG